MKGTRYSELQIFAVLCQAEGGMRPFDEDVVWMATYMLKKWAVDMPGSTQAHTPLC
jgi:hypothetical protein